MTALPPAPEKNLAAKKWGPLLIIGIIGLFGSIAVYKLLKFRPIDLLMMLVVVFFVTIGYHRRFVRGIMTIVIIYLSTGFAGVLYRQAAPYVGAILRALSFDLSASAEDSATRGDLAFTFILLTILFWIVLEIILRVFSEDTSIDAIGILDNLGGVAVYFVVGVLVASLLFNAIGYGRSRNEHNAAKLRRPLNQILYLHYTAQSFWFAGNPPPLYTYDLNAR